MATSNEPSSNLLLTQSVVDGLLSFTCGIKDALVGCVVAIGIVIKNAKIRNKVCLSFILNGFVLALSVILFEYIVLPSTLMATDFVLGLFGKNLSQEHFASLESILSFIFTGLWMLPMFIVCTPINSIWFREIALEANSHSKFTNKKSLKWGLKLMITDLLYGMAVEVVFTVQATAISFLPIGGQFLSVIHMAFLYSLYTFEYKWFYQGVSVQKRLSLIEIKWPYFLGFGMIQSLLTCVPLLLPFNDEESGIRHTVGNVVLGTCVFALVFPLMILASFRTVVPDINFFQIPVFKLSRLTCNKLFNCLLNKSYSQ